MINSPLYTLAFTGHRPNKLQNDYELTSPYVHKIWQDIVNTLKLEQTAQYYRFIVGGALGIDTLAALIALDFHIPYVLAVPCAEHDSKWTKRSRDVYEWIKQQAEHVHYVSIKPYSSSCMQQRNQFMVDHAHALYAVWNGTSGGTENCINYAKSVNKPIIYHHL